METQTYEERQEDEVDFLQCVFMNDFEDLRKLDPWKIKRPPEIQLFLTPQKSMGTSSVKERVQVSVKLHAKYTTDYPDTPPEIQLLDPQRLSPDLVNDLLKQIKQLAKEKMGEVMMLEIVQYVQEFLHKHDLPPVSLHEEMIIRRKKEDEEERQRRQRERLRQEEEEQIKLEQAMLRNKAMELALDLEDNSSSGSEDGITSDSPEKPIGVISVGAGSPLRPVKRDEPQQSKPQRNVDILRGKLLGISSTGGYSVYSGMECVEGDMIAIYEWKIPCKTAASRTKRMKQVASIRQEFEHLLVKDMFHSSLVQYIEMRHEVTDTCITVEVVCENVRGGNLNEILRNPNTGPLTGQTLQHYSRQLLSALDHLHCRGIVHNDLRPSLVFVEPEKGIKLGGFTTIKRLSDLSRPIGRSEDVVSWPSGLKDSRGGKKQDILKLGMLVLCMSLGSPDLSYPPVIPAYLPDNIRDFLNKCLDENEYKRYPSHDLLSHSFITPSPLLTHLQPSLMMNEATHIPHSVNGGFTDHLQFQHSEGVVVGSPGDIWFPSNTRSRLGTDFDELEVLGSGGFGDVVKVKNRLDGRLYAIKKIKLVGGNKMMNKLTREVELLSQMSHENIVRYYNAWIESYTDPDAETTNDDSLDFEDDSSSSSASSDESSSDEEEDGSEGEMDNSMFVEFRSDASLMPQSKPDPVAETEEVFEFSADFNSSNLPIGTQQLEAKIMDLSPRRFRRSETESSEGIVFQESSSTTQTNPPEPFSEETEEEEEEQKEKCRRRGPRQTQYLHIQMEYCSNQTVRQLIDSGQLVHKQNSDREWELFREIVEGLTHIHAQGMIHRDLKPGNIFLNSSGHIKIGDFGLAISFNKHPVLSRQSSTATSSSAVLAGETGLVGTALYLAPELLTPKHVLKYSPKVDIYSLGIIFFEMCHPPVSTLMERAKIITDIRKKEIKFPETFDQEKMSRQALVIKWLLNHDPHERPTSRELLQSPHIPYKIVDEELQEVISRTLQNPNSSRYRRLLDELFSQQNPRLMEISFYMDSKGQESRRGFDKVKSSYSYTLGLLRDHLRSTATSIFAKHCALHIQTPFLGPSSQNLDPPLSTRLMEPTGKILSLPQDHWLSFARHIIHKDITSLKRYDFMRTFLPPKIPGTHPKESDEFSFDIVTPSPELLADSEVIAVALDLLSDLSMSQQGIQFTLWLNHTSLTTAILNYCSISLDQHHIVLQLLYKVSSGRMKLGDLEKSLQDKHNVRLSPLAHKTLLKFMSSEIPLNEVDTTLLCLSRCRTSVSTLAKQALKDIKKVLSQLEVYQVKACIHPGVVLNPAYFEGIIFQFVQQEMPQAKKKKHPLSLAVGGRYDKLVDSLRKGGKLARESFGGGRDTGSSAVAMCGISIKEEVLLSSMCKAFVVNQNSFLISKCHALVCWLGRDSLHAECNELVRDLRERGVAVDTIYETPELEEIQDYCRKRFISHIIILERSLWMRQQVKVRTLESGRVMDRVATEKTIGTNELIEYIHVQTKHGVERSDSTEVPQPPGVGSKSSTSASDVTTGGSISITTVGRQKLQGNTRKRMNSQTWIKLFPLLQGYSSKYAVEIVVVDFELEPLCLLAAEINKAFGQGRQDLSSVVKSLTESDGSLGKKYVAKVCETIQEKMTEKSSVVIVYSHVIEQCQIIVNNSLIKISAANDQ